MPPTITELIAAASNTANQTNYTTASISPTPNSLLVAAVAWGDNPANLVQPTCSGCGLTWEAVQAVQTGTTGTAAEVALQIFAAYADPAVLSNGTVTFTGLVSSGTADGAIWSIYQIERYRYGGSGVLSITNINSNSVTADTMNINSGTAVLDSQSLVMSIICTINDGSSTAPTISTHPTGWTALTNAAVSLGTEGLRLGAAYNTASDVTADWAVSSTNDREMGVLFEVPFQVGATLERRAVVRDQAVHRASRW